MDNGVFPRCLGQNQLHKQRPLEVERAAGVFSPFSRHKILTSCSKRIPNSSSTIPDLEPSWRVAERLDHSQFHSLPIPAPGARERQSLLDDSLLNHIDQSASLRVTWLRTLISTIDTS